MKNMREKIALGSVIALLLVVVIIEYSNNQVYSATSMVGGSEGPINVTLLNNAGVMIEANGMRIYIDPVDLPSEYRDYPADAILITHDHGDHYQSSVINMLQKEGTVNVFPEIMSTEITRHDGVGVDPEDEVMVGDIKITPYYMYTFSNIATQGASHPAENNYTSYIVDIGGFTVFHAGDTKNLSEYESIGSINVAMLPLGPGCQTMAEDEVVAALDEIEPDYFIPLHFTEGQNDQFCSLYRDSIEALTECELCNLDNYSTHTFTRKVV
jgi:L-ascorbate metabolism protein UlaG (beta-lactamase superfamily)